MICRSRCIRIWTGWKSKEVFGINVTGGKMRKRPLCLAAVLLLGIQVILTGWFGFADDLKLSGLENHAEEGDTLTVQGTVSRREEKPEYQVYYLTENQIRLKEQIIEESKILVYIKREGSQNQQSNIKQKIAVGNKIRICGEVSFFQEAVNPGNFDQKFYYQKKGIHAMVWAEEAEVFDPSEDIVREGLAVIRSRWKKLFVDVLGEYYGNSMSAIMLGDKSELDAEVSELFSKSGIGHLLAISGLHMSFLGIGVYQALRKLGLGFLPSGGTGILFLVLYTLMIGSGVSSTRALVMFIVRIGADMSGRDYDMPTSMSLAAAAIVLCQPLYLLDAGFLLSFGAILGITVINPVLEDLRILPKFFCAGISIHLTLLPVLLYYYFELPTYSILLNLLVVPLMSGVLGIGIIGSVLWRLWEPAGAAVLQVSKGILWLYEQSGDFSLKLPFGRLVLGQPGRVWIAVYYGILFGGCILLSQYRKHSDGSRMHSAFLVRSAVRAGIVALSVLFCLLCRHGHGKPGELQVVMLDVGQGDGLYIRTPSGRHYFVDGGSTDVKNVGKYRIEPFLKSQGVGVLDFVFISHGDADHLNGVQEMLMRQKYGVRIDTLVLPTEAVLDEALKHLAATAWENGTDVVTIRKGQKIADAGMTVTCLAPSDEYGGEIGNASSMILDLQYQAFDMLFTGDVEGEGETILTEDGGRKQYDVLKTAHHGSKNSTSEEFLEQVMPGIALISAGRENRYGHPHEETMERLEKCGARIFNTQDCGAIRLKSNGETISIETFLP